MNIVTAKYCGNYKIEFTFSDGKVNSIDFKTFLFNSSNPLITRFKDKNLFKNFSIKPRYVEWDNDMDFSATDIYLGKI
ncbi:MAG: hypothetical protein RI955_1386 [Bacteroidota bacterium]|jgi:hypothetical protein